MPRLRIFDQILNQEPKIVNLNQKSDFAFLYPTKVKKSIKDIVLSREWIKQSICMMVSSKEIFLQQEKTGCGKTTFVQNLGRSNLFGDISEVYWISKIVLSR